MTSFSRTSFALSLVATIALLGAGCANSSSSNPPNTVQPSTTTTPGGSDAGAVPTGSPNSITTSSTLDTTGWQSYTNKTLKFVFQSPVKGPFAPEYAVKLLPLTSAEIQNDCAKANGLPNATEAHVTVNGTAFCRTITFEGAAGSTYNQETWVTKTEKWYAVMTFTKKYVTDPRIIGGCEDGGKDVGKPRCLPFDTEGYRRQIEAILSTFHFPAASV